MRFHPAIRLCSICSADTQKVSESPSLRVSGSLGWMPRRVRRVRRVSWVPSLHRTSSSCVVETWPPPRLPPSSPPPPLASPREAHGRGRPRTRAPFARTRPTPRTRVSRCCSIATASSSRPVRPLLRSLVRERSRKIARARPPRADHVDSASDIANASEFDRGWKRRVRVGRFARSRRRDNVVPIIDRSSR
jgi:hypothetical protein